MIKAIIFDVGGVMVRTHDWSHRTKWDDKLNLKHGTVEQTVFNSYMGKAAQLGEITNEAKWHWIQKEYGLSQRELLELRRDFWAGDRLDTDLISLIWQLRRNHKLAIISNWSDALNMQLTSIYPIAHAFDLVVGSAYEGIMKPNAIIFERALDRLGVEAESAVFIDDFAHNIDGAHAVGMKGIHFHKDMDLRVELEKLGVEI